MAASTEAGRIVGTANEDAGIIAAANLRDAHVHQESDQAIGKTVLAGFGE